MSNSCMRSPSILAPRSLTGLFAQSSLAFTLLFQGKTWQSLCLNFSFTFSYKQNFASQLFQNCNKPMLHKKWGKSFKDNLLPHICTHLGESLALLTRGAYHTWKGQGHAQTFINWESVIIQSQAIYLALVLWILLN